ncbi:hypothetical protein GCM10007416_19680 [Kroppenstedtia guangzhouensis]|uniref:Uncharacterized protein n=1 Tax=Kroppenstedtia guangzhouensis TaxID=1274356 RepID=A0ABQ1GM84_9BACL|nr:hypothetical protein GCM10007416_19680 [Kroppenstedtia guangzhouensis]
MVKAILPESQFLGPERRGVRKLIETHTERGYEEYFQRSSYSPPLSQRIGDASKRRTGTYVTSIVFMCPKRRWPKAGLQLG